MLHDVCNAVPMVTHNMKDEHTSSHHVFELQQWGCILPILRSSQRDVCISEAMFNDQ